MESWEVLWGRWACTRYEQGAVEAEALACVLHGRLQSGHGAQRGHGYAGSSTTAAMERPHRVNLAEHLVLPVHWSRRLWGQRPLRAAICVSPVVPVRAVAHGSGQHGAEGWAVQAAAQPRGRHYALIARQAGPCTSLPV